MSIWRGRSVCVYEVRKTDENPTQYDTLLLLYCPCRDNIVPHLLWCLFPLKHAAYITAHVFPILPLILHRVPEWVAAALDRDRQQTGPSFLAISWKEDVQVRADGDACSSFLLSTRKRKFVFAGAHVMILRFLDLLLLNSCRK